VFMSLWTADAIRECRLGHLIQEYITKEDE